MSRSRTADITSVERGKHDKDGRRRCLIEAATQVFAEKGFDAATTRAVAELAGCSEGLIHRYFGGKRGLLIAILNAMGETMYEDRAEQCPAQDTLEAEIEQLMLWPLERYWEQRDFMRVSVSQSVIDPDVGLAVRDRLNGVHVAFMTDRLKWHQEARRIRADADVAAIALSISGLNISLGFLAQVTFEMDRAETRRRAREMAGVITRGLAPDAVAGSPVTIAVARRRAVAPERERRRGGRPESKIRVEATDKA